MPRRGERIDEVRPPDALPAPAVARLPDGISNAGVARLLARDVATDEEPPITAPGITGMQQWHERGAAHYNARRYEKALHAYQQAFELHEISTLLYEQADCLEKLQRFEEAADMYQRYLDNGPLTADILPVRSRMRKLRGEQIPVGEDDDEAPIMAKGKEGARAWFDRAQEKFQAKRFAQAAECFRQAFALVPLPEFIFNEATALEKGGHPAAAANAFEHYLIVDPAAADAKEVVEKVKTLRGQAPPGGPDALIDPEDEPAEAPAVTAKGKRGASEWHTRGQVAYLVGDFRRAYEAWESAYELFPNAAFVYNQAAALDRLGNVEAAIQAYERYLALAPKAGDAAQVHKIIERLRRGTTAGDLKAPRE
jgi:tetratricopeptide (TPR) repeat protein